MTVENNKYVQISSTMFIVGLIFAFIGFCLFLAKGIEFLEYIFSQYGTYIVISFFFIPCVVHSISNVLSPSSNYFIREAPFFLPIGFFAILILPFFDKNGYPTINSEGGLIYYTFLSIPAMLLASDLIAFIIKKLGGKSKSMR